MKHKISKFQAFLLAKKEGVDFSKDFHAQSVGGIMTDIAKLEGYRKPQNASGSRGRYFFYHIQRIANKNNWK